MATKRMFANSVIDADEFVELSAMQQLLYFHLGMKTDDDGFVIGGRKIAKIIGASDGDFESLVKAGFLIEFSESKVFVVVHHKINNDLKNDRYHSTIYQNELAQLVQTDNKKWQRKQPVSSLETDCIQNVSSLETDCIQNVSSLETEQNVAQENVTQENVTQTSGGEESVGRGTEEIVNALAYQCRIDGLNVDVFPLVRKYGFDKVHDAEVKWKEHGKPKDGFMKILEGE